MKRILKKSLICILILFVLMNFASANINYTYAGEALNSFLEHPIQNLFTGLIGVISWIPRALFMAGLLGINVIISGFANLGLGTGTFEFVTPFHIFFNEISLLNVNFFNFDESLSEVVLTFRTAVAGWYYTIRLIAAMILAVILIYIGIRMALSTIASEKAMYKKMLVDWATSLALLFLLHYIMIFVLSCNEAIVNALKTIFIDGTGTNVEGVYSSFSDMLIEQSYGVDVVAGFASIILYGIIIYQTVIFLFAYVKRMLTIGFLIMIAPLITITYSIDKIGDGKAQALNTWLKEFSYNILIQPFHCILFAAFAFTAFDIIGLGGEGGFIWESSSIAELILAIACIQFIKTGEGLVKKIFGFGQSSSLADMAAGVAATGAAIKYGGKVASKGGAVAAKATGKIAEKVKSNEKLTNAVNRVGGKVGGALGKLSSMRDIVDKDGNLTKHGNKIAEKRADKAKNEALKSNPNLSEEEAQKVHAQKLKFAQESLKAYGNSSSITKSIQKSKAERRENQIDKKLEKQYGKDGFKKLVQDEEKHKEAREKAGKEIDAEKAAKREKRKEISGAAGKFVKKNSSKMATYYGGIITGLVGFGGGFDTAMAFGSVGSGFVQGYMSNSHKTIKSENESAAISSLNLSGNTDIKSHTEDIYMRSLNGEFDKVTEQLHKIFDKLQSITGSKKESVTRDFRTKVNEKILRDPAGLNEEFINKFATENGITDSNDINLLKQYASLSADANYANKIKTATSAGMSLDQIIGALGNIKVTVDTSKVEGDIADVQSNLNKFEKDVSTVNNKLNNEGNN